MTDIVDIFRQGVHWFTYFKGFEVVVPFLAALSAAWWVHRKFKQQVVLLTGELRNVASNFDRSVKETVKNVKPEFEAAASVIEEKRSQLQKSMTEFAARVASGGPTEGEVAGDVADADEEIRWSQMQARWREVKEWLDWELDDAIKVGPPSRSKALKAIRKTDYDAVIISLFKYGWIGDKATDAGLALSGIYKQHKNRRIPVTTTTLREYQRLFKQWDNN